MDQDNARKHKLLLLTYLSGEKNLLFFPSYNIQSRLFHVKK